MTFYVIMPASQPDMIFACSTKNPLNKNRSVKVEPQEGTIEISYHDFVDLFIESNKGVYSAPPGSVSLFMPDCRYKITAMTDSNENVSFSLSTVAVKFNSVDYIRFDETDATKIYEIMEQYPDHLIIPQTLFSKTGSSPDITEASKVIKTKMQFLISTYRDKSARGKYSCLSQWYEICSEIDYAFRNLILDNLHMAKQEHTNAYYYIYKAQKYILAHIRESINPIDISNSVGLKHAYFIRTFKKEKGMSLNEYIHRLKIQTLCTMIERHPTRSFKQLVFDCGFTDFRHTQRLFKKYVGMNMSDYKKLKKGLTLYHDNPWNPDNVPV